MTEAKTADVRAWAQQTGMDVPAKGRLSAAVWAAFASEHADADQEFAPDPEPDAIVIDLPERDRPTDLPDDLSVPETPPEPLPAPERGWKRWSTRKAREPGQKPRKRVSLEFLAGMAWSGAAAVTANLLGPQYAPVGMMMAFQAPVAGMVLEDAAKDTAADKFLQPIAKLVQPGGQIATLIGMPLGTAVICKYPHLYPRMRPLLEQGMKEWVTIAGPKLREMRRKQEKFAEEMSTFKEEFGVSIEELLDDVFAPLLQGPAYASANGSHPA